ncbi:MAG: ribonuclease R family protein [Kiritimatiellia bacterium]
MTNSNDLARRVGALFSSPKYRPLPERDLAQQLRLGPGQRGRLRQILRDLQNQGQAAPFGGGRWGAPPASVQHLTGTFCVRPNGSCWLLPDGPRQPPMWIDPASAGAAMNGDKIQAVPVRRDMSVRMLGAKPDTKTVRIARILERKRQWVVGILQAAPHYAYVVPRDPLLRANIKLTDSPAKLERHLGNLVVARIVEDEPSEGRPVVAAFSKDLGDPDGVENDVEALLLDRGFTEAFPEDVDKAAHQARAHLVQRGADARGRVDLRNQCVLAIDPATAHDHDDAVSIEALPGGRWKLGVHIADVPAFVEPGSAIDREALRRGNSTYLVDRVVRMLPKDLTVSVCSLLPGEDHLAHTVEIVFDAHGRAAESKTFRSVIRAKAILSYEQVQAFFDVGRLDGASAEIREALLGLRKLARKIRALRFENGALDFALPEVHCDLDAQGHPVGFTRRGATEAYNLVEECMLAANQAVARKVFDAGVPGIYRVHDEPSDEQWARMADELRALGHRTPPEDARDLNRIARAALGRPEQYIVTLTLLRNMKRAAYDAECSPHFGLGFAHYAHFTSPIRRYPDLVLHRILCAIEEGRKTPAYSVAEIEKLALHCSETERESGELESQSIQVKRIRYFASRLAQGEIGPFKGTIVSLNPKGLIVELADSLQQGMLPYYSLGKERYFLAPDNLSASARRGAPFRLGQSIEVGLAAVDEHARRVDFFLPGSGKSAPRRGETPARPHPHKPIDKPAGKVGNKPPCGNKRSAQPRRHAK